MPRTSGSPKLIRPADQATRGRKAPAAGSSLSDGGECLLTPSGEWRCLLRAARAASHAAFLGPRTAARAAVAELVAAWRYFGGARPSDIFLPCRSFAGVSSTISTS